MPFAAPGTMLEQRILIGIEYWVANSCVKFTRVAEDYAEKHIQIFKGTAWVEVVVVVVVVEVVFVVVVVVAVVV